MDVVDTANEAAELGACAARGARAAGGVPRRARASAPGRLEAERIGEGHSNVTFLVRAATPRVRAAPPAAPAPAAVRPRRAARGAAAAGARGHRRAHAAVLAACDDESVIGVPFYVMEDERRERDHHRDARAARHAGRAAAHGRGARGRARRDACRGLARVRARGLRQAHRLPRAPAAPLRRALGAQQDARAAGGAGARRVAGRRTCPSRRSRRSCTATTGSAT